MNVKKALRKIVDYAHGTGIKFEQTGRYHHAHLGIPDCRGFTPHLRTVNLNKNQSARKLLTPSHRWLLHDVLHIMFYDFANYHLRQAGLEPWIDEMRFMENHLASEAFAVLALDYHLLSHTKEGGLAADVNKTNRESFQKINARLPAFDSPEFCHLLVDLYLTGDSSPLANPHKKYLNWLGHEIRYSDKQRFYVKQWWNDLNLKNENQKAVVIKNSAVGHGVWELLDLLFLQPDQIWKSWIRSISTGPTNYFQDLPKYKQEPTVYDFRFTDIRAVPHQMFTELNGSSLFGFWQIVSMVPPRKLDNQDKIKALARSVQTQKPNVRIWNQLKNLLNDFNGEEASQKRACFFLP